MQHFSKPLYLRCATLASLFIYGKHQEFHFRFDDVTRTRMRTLRIFTSDSLNISVRAETVGVDPWLSLISWSVS